MRLAIMQPYFFPYIGYFQLIRAVDRFILYNRVNYIKKGWINRNRILRVNNEPFFITVPLVNASSFLKIYEIRMFNQSNWNHKILKDILYNYKKSPYFDAIMPIIEDILLQKLDYLYELNCYAIKEICNYLDIKTELVFDNPYFPQLEKDLLQHGSDLNRFFAKERHLEERKVIRIIHICEMEGAHSYINPIGGRTLYDPYIFAENGVRLNFVQTQVYQYQQNSVEFFNNLSIIDVLMNCGKEGTKQILERYELV